MSGVTGDLRRPTSTMIIWGLACGVLVLLNVMQRAAPPEPATIVMDMRASAGSRAHVYVNRSGEPIVAPLSSTGERRSYSFPAGTDDITYLRLDPTNTAGAEVTLYSLEVRDSEGTARRYDAEALCHWTRSNAVALPADDGGCRISSVGAPPVFAVTDSIILRHKRPRWLGRVAAAAQSGSLVDAVAGGGFLLLLLVGLTDPRGRWHLPLAVVIGTSGVLLLLACRSWLDGWLNPIEVAVGRASYFGLSNKSGQMASFLAAGAAAVLAWGAAAIARPPAPASDGGENDRRPGREQSAVVATLLMVALVLLYAPDLRAIGLGIAAHTFDPQWDSNNIVYWSYLTSRGFLPSRDFWYPYAGFYLTMEPLPGGALLYWVYSGFIYSAFAWCVHALCRGRWAVAAVAVLLLIAGEHSGVLSNTGRYLLAVVVVLSFYAIDRERRGISATLCLFWVACPLTLFFEPAQLVYAFPAVLLKLTLDAFGHRERDAVKALIGRLLREFAVPALASLGVLVVLLAQGRLGEVLASQLRAGDLVAYSAQPTDLSRALQDPGSLEFQVLLLPSMLIGLGVFERLRSAGQRRLWSEALIGLGVLSLIVLQKHLIRPMDGQLRLHLLSGLLAYAALRPGRRTLVDRAWLGVATGALCYGLLPGGEPSALGRLLLGGPARVASTVQVLFRGQALLRQADSQMYARERFNRFPGQQAVADYLRSHWQGAGPPAVFALSDDPVLYVLTGQGPVYAANLYNASPVYEQQRIVDWLTRERVPFVAFNPMALEFDGVPTSVRSPLVFEAVVESYLPLARVGLYEVLRRRTGDEKPSFSYWAETLGPSVRLGHLARLGSGARLRPCPYYTGPDCLEFAEIHLARPPHQTRTLDLPILVGDRAFEASFEVVPRQSDYSILLDRLWFWRLAKAAGMAPRLGAPPRPERLNWRLVRRHVPERVLY